MTEDFTNRMCEYTRKSIGQTSMARSYDRLLNNNIQGLKPVTNHVRDHVTSLIISAQHRARCGDDYNTRILISNAVEIMNDQRVYIP